MKFIYWLIIILLAILLIGTVNSYVSVSQPELNGRLRDSYVDLSWKSFSQRNVKGYEIQRGTDGANFTTIGVVEAYRKAADSTYYFADNRIMQTGATLMYYRLKVNEADGSFSYSNILKIAIGKDISTVTVRPNPAKSEVQVLFNLTTKDNVTLYVYDSQGRLLQQKQYQLEKGPNTKILYLGPSWKSGEYFLIVRGQQINAQFKIAK